MNRELFQQHVKDIYKIVHELEKMFKGRSFTPDGHMVGSLGECIVANDYNLKLMPSSNKGFDAKTKEGKEVEIKTTQSKSVAFRSCPEHTIIIKIKEDGTYDECYNGPGDIIWKTFDGKDKPKNGQYSIGLGKIAELYNSVHDTEKIPKIK